jgi:hypothetical protein
MVKKKVDIDSDLDMIRTDLKDIKSFIYNIERNSSCKPVKHHYKWFHDPWYWFGWCVIVIMLLFTVWRC